MIIDIFGDSFSDTSIKQQDTDTWTDILRNKYKFNLRNYSKHGTGLQWSIEQFLKLETHGDYLLFCLADMNRVAFEYIKDEEQAHALLLYNMLNDNNHDFPDTINKDVIKKSKKIFNDYESFYSTGLNRLLEVLFVSFIFSKSKFSFFSCFTVLPKTPVRIMASACSAVNPFSCNPSFESYGGCEKSIPKPIVTPELSLST